MSQLDLSVEAQTTARYVSFVETGRASPSREMVIRLATALDVPFRERNALLMAAGYAPLYPRAAAGLGGAAARERRAHHDDQPSRAVPGGDHGPGLERAAGERRRAAAVRWPVASGADARAGQRPASDDRARPGAGVGAQLGAGRRHAARAGAPRGRRRDPGRRDRRAARRPGERPEVAAIRRGGEPPVEPVLDVRFRFGGHDLAFFSLLTTVGTPIDLTSQELRVEEFFPLDDATREFWADVPGR